MSKELRAEDNDEYLTRVVVDTCARTFRLYSNEGDDRVVNCDSMEEFMNVLDVVRKTCPEERLVYAEPLSEKA